jgi:O-antigen ligase
MIFYSIKEKFLFYSLPVILFSLLPFFLITGPFLSDLSVSIIVILFFIYCARQKKFLFYFNNKYFYFFLTFYFYLLINSSLINFNIDSLKISFFYFRYGVFVIAIYYLLKVNSEFSKYFFYCIFLCFSILIVDGYYQYFMGTNILGFVSPDRLRVSSFFGEEMILGSYLCRLWPIYFGLSIYYIKKKDKLFLLFILIFVLSETLIFLSGDRTAFFYINLSTIFVILFSQKLFKLRLMILISSIFLIIVISIFVPAAKERVIDKTLNQMNFNDENINEKKNIFSKEHTNIYISAYNIFLDNKVFGVGVKNFRNTCKELKYYVNDKEACNTHPHNTYIQILAEIGIIGFLFFIIVIFYFCKYVFKHLLLKLNNKYYFSDFEICILSGIIIYLWPFIPTGNVFNNWLNIALILNLPFLILSRNSIKTQ